MNRIKSDDVIELIKELPGIKSEPEVRNYRNIYSALRWFTEYTKHLIEIEETAGVEQCFSLTEKLLKEGDKNVRDAVEIEYVFSLGTFIDLQNRGRIKKMFKPPLRDIYINQVMSSRI